MGTRVWCRFFCPMAAVLGLIQKCLAPDAPEITANLWGMARFAYLDNPLPSLFKERLFVYLSRFCQVRYCIARHVGFLVGLGRPSGDRHCPPEKVEQAVRLIGRPLPRGDALPPHLAVLATEATPLGLPESGTPVEEAVFACATHVFLQTPEAARCQEALRQAFGEARLQHVLLFLTFVRAAHYWTRIHPELTYEDDVEELLATHSELADRVLNDPEASACDTTTVILDELHSLRRELTHREEMERSRIERAPCRGQDRRGSRCRPPKDRVPGHPGPRATQPAGPDPQRCADPANHREWE
jgi:hypothetical protein